jgi:hypothetical protein
MMLRLRKPNEWPLPSLAAALSMMLGGAAAAQDTPAPPDRFETARLVWNTLIAVDHANRTGNYSVLRDLAAPGFRKANDPARLAAIFAKVREQELGLGRVVLAAPVYAEPPKVLENGLYRVKGSFPARPVGVNFDLLYQHAEGEWRLFGIGVAPAEAAEAPTTEAGSPPPLPKPNAAEE